MISSDDRAPQPRARSVTFTPAGIAGTIILAAVVILFLRLGFWQLDRRAQRVATNEAIAARLEQEPVASVDALADTSGLTYRIATVRGTLDNERYIILPGRGSRGVPGVHLLMALRLEGRDDAILVNRGWVPSADAATIDASDFALHDPVTIEGLVLAFPNSSQSLAQRTTEAPPGEFRHVWYSVDERALRAQFPYPLLDATLQERSGSEVQGIRYPLKLEPPPLDEGPHLGYALQWFGFALIGVIGWLALVLRSRARAAAVVPFIALLLLPGNASAQLRPLDPLDWRIFDDNAVFIAGAGAGLMLDQPAPLAGTRGTLLEGGLYSISYRSGRIAAEFGGTAIWRMSDEEQLAPPIPGVEPANGVRQDAGVAFASSAIRISPDGWPADLILRFGATIPTTSDESGLDRDRIDFFALLGARYSFGAWSVMAENGVGINGTLRQDLPQSDVWTFAYGVAWRNRDLRLTADLVGRQDGHSYVIRGNEDQRELRGGIEIGRDRWVRLQYIHGLSDFSPAHGVRVSAGFTRRR